MPRCFPPGLARTAQQQGMSVCIHNFFPWATMKKTKRNKATMVAFEMHIHGLLDSGVWGGMAQMATIPQDRRRRILHGALCSHLASQDWSGRMRGCEDTRKMRCVTHESSGYQYRLWGRHRSISGIFRQPRIALTSSGCCGWTFCILHIYLCS